MNKRKRTAHRRAALWGPRRAYVDCHVDARREEPGVEAPGSGYTVRQMTVEEAADAIDAIVAAEAERRGGPMPPLTVAPDRGAEVGAAVMRAARRRWEALGLVPKRADG
jgi:hypothetical protein